LAGKRFLEVAHTNTNTNTHNHIQPKKPYINIKKQWWKFLRTLYIIAALFFSGRSGEGLRRGSTAAEGCCSSNIKGVLVREERRREGERKEKVERQSTTPRTHYT